MYLLLNFSLIYALTIFGIGVYERFSNERKWALYLCTIGALLPEAATRMFLIDNFGRNVALHEYDYTGLKMLSFASIVIMVGFLIVWWRSKKWMPYAIPVAMGLGQLAIVVLLSFYYDKTS